MWKLNCIASQATNGGAMIAPIELPATHRLLAVALSFPENQTATTLICAGKLVGSAAPNSPLKNKKEPNVRDIPPPRQATDHPIIPPNITQRSPNLSTNHPATGYIKA